MKRVPADPEARRRERATEGKPVEAPEPGFEPGRESAEEPAGALADPASLASLDGAQPATPGVGSSEDGGRGEPVTSRTPAANRPADEVGDGARVPAGLRSLLGGDWRQTALYIDAAYTLLGAVLGLGFIGWLGDRMLGTRPVLLLVGLLLGLVVGFYRLGRAMFGGR